MLPGLPFLIGENIEFAIHGKIIHIIIHENVKMLISRHYENIANVSYLY